MDITKFMSLGAAIETDISAVYEKVSTLTADQEVSAQLKKISCEELNHAAALNMGKNYLAQAPDVFLGVNMEEDEMKQGLAELENLSRRLNQDILLLPALKWLLDLEKRFEKIHLGVSVSIGDEHLAQLFKSLTKGDQNHIATLDKIIEGVKD